MRVRDGDRVPRPLEKLDVVLAVPERKDAVRVEAEVRSDERHPRALRHLRARELEEVRERLGDVEAPVEARLHARLEVVERVRVADRDELRRRPREPGEEVADRAQREVLDVGVPASLGRHGGDVELVVEIRVR